MNQTEPDPAEARYVRRFWISTVLLTPVVGLILFLAAGTIAWPGAWAFVAVSWIAAIAGGLVIPRSLAAERGRIPEDIAPYDKVIAPLIARTLPLATFIVAGLDFRYGWSPVVALVPAGFIAVVAGSALLVWAMASNVFFSGVMRIQSERGHRTVDGGPYAFVRHPGYTGLMLYSLGTPLLLGSLWAMIPATATIVLTLLRTVLEDRALRQELEGYQDYSVQVRFRLLPGVW